MRRRSRKRAPNGPARYTTRLPDRVSTNQFFSTGFFSGQDTEAATTKARRLDNLEEMTMIPEPEEPGDPCSDNDSVWNGYREDDIESPPDPTQTDDEATNGSPDP